MYFLGTIHLRRQHVLGGEGYPHVPTVKRSQYIRIENPLHKHFAGMPMVGGEGSKIVKNCRRLKWMVPNSAFFDGECNISTGLSKPDLKLEHNLMA